MKKLCIYILGVFIIIILISQCLTFGGTKQHTISINPATPVDEYQVMLLLGRNTFNYKAAQPDGSDIRILDIQGNNLNFWIENWNPYGVSIVWVRVPDAGTDKVMITCGDPGETPGSDGTKVFDPVNWDTLKTGWLYSGIIRGMVSGWEYPLTEFDLEVNDWTLVDIDTDYTEECEHSRWFVRKEVFIAQGEITFSGVSDDDAVWTLIRADEIYRKIGGNELDSDGINPGSFSGKIIMKEPFGHFIWAGRGQEGLEEEMLTLLNIDSGIENLYTRKIVDAPVLELIDEEPGEESEDMPDTEPVEEAEG